MKNSLTALQEMTWFVASLSHVEVSSVHKAGNSDFR